MYPSYLVQEIEIQCIEQQLAYDEEERTSSAPALVVLEKIRQA